MLRPGDRAVGTRAETSRAMIWSRPEILDVLMPEDGPELSAFERQMRGGELKAILGRAARGELRDESWKPVRRDPTLWELRWKWDDGGQLRGYFHEPALDPDSTILAKVHRKEIIASRPRSHRVSSGCADRRSGDPYPSPRTSAVGYSSTAAPSPDLASLTPDIDSNL